LLLQITNHNDQTCGMTHCWCLDTKQQQREGWLVCGRAVLLVGRSGLLGESRDNVGSLSLRQCYSLRMQATSRHNTPLPTQQQ